jgi:hypothetical protein
MADPEFEARLGRLFAQSPVQADNAAFADRVSRRLDRAWTWRRLLIGGLGVAGGLIGVGQVVASGVVGRAEILSSQSAKVLSVSLANHLPSRLLALWTPLGADLLWAAGALAILAVGLAVMRSIGDI